MTNPKQKKKNKLAIFAGITGAIVGVGATIAGAFALKDKKNRDKVKKVLTKAKNQAKGYIKKIDKKNPKKKTSNKSK